jgi:hypothetical protein
MDRFYLFVTLCFQMPSPTFLLISALQIPQEADICYKTKKQATTESSIDYVLKSCLYVSRLH